MICRLRLYLRGRVLAHSPQGPERNPRMKKKRKRKEKKILKKVNDFSVVHVVRTVSLRWHHWDRIGWKRRDLFGFWLCEFQSVTGWLFCWWACGEDVRHGRRPLQVRPLTSRRPGSKGKETVCWCTSSFNVFHLDLSPVALSAHIQGRASCSAHQMQFAATHQTSLEKHTVAPRMGFPSFQTIYQLNQVDSRD